ncbi:glyoxalase [Bacillus coahuilensis p1.1.43]|uniref:Glyoxalase n=1 Tax=Bacillus coahuilensis p1.1.43 TaxID=1150625 RepID=A0A147KAC8_9BACI|nr:VOC family protein [Bacillus coahuilensis]KUP07637.1 glyoxalase [Bacillus coahuilensis p1.1.43]
MFTVGSIFIPVNNLEESIEWYQKVLNIHLLDRWESEEEKGAGFCFHKGDIQLGLIEVKSSDSTEFNIDDHQKNSYYNFKVGDIKAACHHLMNQDVKVTKIENFGGMKFFDFFDLHGHSFSVVEEVAGSPFHSDHIKRIQSTL